jgi:AraC-like DNA-binding protein
MPKIIRQALGERIRRDPDLRQILADLARATGVRVAFAGPLGHLDTLPDPESAPLCARLRDDAAGCQLCRRFQQSLFEAAAPRATALRCDAGLVELAVPLRAAGMTLGYLVIAGFTAEPVNRSQLNRARHLLSRQGVQVPEAELAHLLERTPQIPPVRQASLLNVLQLAAEHLTAKITARLVQTDAGLPPLVEKACRIVRAEYAQPVSVPEIARRLGASEGHLSRTFHRATGLRLVEYVARFRAERAREQLCESDKPVIDIAFACGFRSLSQFNRVFRAQFGQRPRDARANARQKPGAGAIVAPGSRT